MNRAKRSTGQLAAAIIGNVLVTVAALAGGMVGSQGNQCVGAGSPFSPGCLPGPMLIGLVLGFGALRIGAAVIWHAFRRDRPTLLLVGAMRGLANGILILTLALAFVPSSVDLLCTTSQVCIHPDLMVFALGAIAAAITFVSYLLRRPEPASTAAGGKANEAAPVLEESDQSRVLLRDLVFPLLPLLAIVVVGAVALGTQPQYQTLFFGIAAFAILRAAARVLYYFKVPKRLYNLPVAFVRGLAWGALAVLALLNFIPSGPGMPNSAYELGLFITCVAYLSRYHAIVKGPGLPVLISIVAAIGLGAWAGYNAYTFLIASLPLPYTGQLLYLAAVIYAVFALRVILAFTGEDESQKDATVFDWLRANFWRNFVLVVILGAYLAFRDQIAAVVPDFPVVEFMIGLAVFGAVVARARSRLRATLSEGPVTANWKPHEQRIERLAEPEFDQVNGVIGDFLQNGKRKGEYAKVVAQAAHLDGPDADQFVAPVLRHREVHRYAPEPWVAVLAGRICIAAASAYALYRFIELASSPGTEIVGIVPLGLILSGIFAFSAQESARRAESVNGLVVVGAISALLLGIGLFEESALHGGPAQYPPVLWAIVIIALLGVVAFPCFRAWKLRKLLATEGSQVTPAERAQRSAKGASQHAKLLLAWAVTALIISVPATAALSFAVAQGLVSDGVRTSYINVEEPVLILLGGLGAASFIQTAAQLAVRPLVKREDSDNEKKRRTLHLQMMRSLEGMT
ncbi:MAG: hypothetical protein ACYDDF_03705 [Thermoplasmatota archaeon]